MAQVEPSPPPVLLDAVVPALADALADAPLAAAPLLEEPPVVEPPVLADVALLEGPFVSSASAPPLPSPSTGEEVAPPFPPAAHAAFPKPSANATASAPCFEYFFTALSPEGNTTRASDSSELALQRANRPTGLFFGSISKHRAGDGLR